MLSEVVLNCQYIFYPYLSKIEFIIGALLLLSLISWRLFKLANSKSDYILTGIVIGGALGNILERAFTGCVADYLNFFGLFNFNLWDFIMCIGVLTLIAKQFIKKSLP